MSRITTHQVGRTTVYVDSHGNPLKFMRDGAEVPCVCDPDSGLRCEYDSCTMAEKARPADSNNPGEGK
jgi:hypothetical protein